MSTYTSTSAFGALSPGAPAPGAAPATPSEPGVLLILKSGARVFVPRPPLAKEDWSADVLAWLWHEVAYEPKIGQRFLRRDEVAFAEVTTSAEADKAATDARKAAEEAKAAAAKATEAADDANAAADEVLGAEVVGEGDVSDWTDEQIRDAIDSLETKNKNRVYGEGESVITVTGDILRLRGILAARAASPQAPIPGPGFVPPGTAN